MTTAVRHILSPRGRGEVRIPALLSLGERLFLFYDDRPAPASGHGSDFTGIALASDLPNPNHLHWVTRPMSAKSGSECGESSLPDEGRTSEEKDAPDEWSAPRPLEGGPAVSSDACVGVDGDGVLHVAFASSDGRVGYMDSRADGERLRAWVAWGGSPEDLTYRELTEELYEATGADALFATSGSTVSVAGRVALPYVVRVGTQTHVRIAYVRGGSVEALSEPIVGEGGLLLDETSVALWEGHVVVNCRIQGFQGRGAGRRYLARSADGLHFEGGRVLELPDPGCNAKQLGDLFLHPHSNEARCSGVLAHLIYPWGEESAPGRVLASFGEAGFGYSDMAAVPGGYVVVFERDGALWEGWVSEQVFI